MDDPGGKAGAAQVGAAQVGGAMGRTGRSGRRVRPRAPGPSLAPGSLFALALLVALVGGQLTSGPLAAAAPTTALTSAGASLAPGSAAPSLAPVVTDSSLAPASASSSPATESADPPPAAESAAPSLSPGSDVPAIEDRVALVPVVDFWSSRRRISLSDLRAALEGRHARYERVVVGIDDLAGLAEVLGVSLAASTTSDRPAAVLRAVQGSRRTLGLVPAGSVRSSVRALDVGKARLFGSGRVSRLEDWPLSVPQELAGLPDAFDPAATWTLLAGGDVMLDREVYRQAVMLGKGPHYPWDGGIARIVSRTCCTAWGGPMIVARRVRAKGAVRALMRSADITLVNHEGPAPDRFSYHPSGFVFTFDPALLVGLERAGIDLVSLANNHIRNAGSRGVTETMRNLRTAGIGSVGAGRDQSEARSGRCLEAAGTRACFLAYNGVNVFEHGATRTRPGAATLRESAVRADIARLRAEGADVVVVVPHWGPEYVDRPVASQRRLARVMVRAGADLVLGGHSHVVGAVRHVRRTPVVYSMGNLLFDLTRFERTLEGVLVEVTFAADRVAQIELHPTVLVARSQLNLLDPDGDGRVVLARMRRASR